MFFENWNFLGSWSFKIALYVFKKFNFLKYYGTKISIFQWRIKIFGPKCLYLIFEVVNFWGFWGPATSGGDKKNKTKVVPSIFIKFWSRNNLDQLDPLTPYDVYKPTVYSSDTVLPTYGCIFFKKPLSAQCADWRKKTIYLFLSFYDKYS